MAQATRLVEVDAPPDPQLGPDPAQARAQQATSMLLLAIRSLGARAIVAAEALVDLVLIASAFVLWLSIIRDPSTPQLVAAVSYAVFVLIAVLIRRRRHAG